MAPHHGLTAILPCDDLDASEAFYARLGFKRRGGDADYRILSDGKGAELHLSAAEAGWLTPGRNPFGLYLSVEDVDGLARSLGAFLKERPAHKPWGMYEFALSDPDDTLVRVGWPSRAKQGSGTTDP
jgi:catechol 2,3-dioxygenase-like lactoylglutathione lyase family enzyme